MFASQNAAIDLSADLGEGSPSEAALWPLIRRANVACGGHAGDAHSMRTAAALAQQHGVAFGAHPSYPDREGFGRVSLRMEPEALRASLVSQLRALQEIAPILHVKPHGALYNDAHRERKLADLIVDAVQAVGPSIAIVCADRSELAHSARARGTPVVREAFADRRYESDGSLTSRSISGSTLTVPEAVEQARLLATEGIVLARNGQRVPLSFDTLCIHADMDGADARARAILVALTP